MTKRQKIVTGVCMSRRLRNEIDYRRGDVPRSKYISRILEQHIHKRQNENKGYVVEEDQQSKSRSRSGQSSAVSLPFPTTKHLRVDSADG